MRGKGKLCEKRENKEEELSSFMHFSFSKLCVVLCACIRIILSGVFIFKEEMRKIACVAYAILSHNS